MYKVKEKEFYETPSVMVYVTRVKTVICESGVPGRMNWDDQEYDGDAWD